MDFATSSHRRRWLYSRKELDELRSRLHERVIDGVRKQRAAADPAEPEAGSASKRPKDPPPVPLQGEWLMLKYYQQIIQEKCREMKLPIKVMATAILYHKRFFLRHTSLEFDPGRIMITAIFMATKVEEYYTRAADIASAFDVSEDLVVRQEVALLEGLNFDLVVHSPYRALQGLIQELKDARAAAAADPSAASSPSSPPGQTPPPGSGPSGGGGYPPLDESLAAAPEALPVEACRRGVGALDALLLSDAPLLYGPAQLAAAALRSGFKARGVRIPNFLVRVAMKAAEQHRQEGLQGPQTEDGYDVASALTAVLDELDALGSEGARRVEVEEVKEANAAAREWRNLLKDVGAGGAKGAAAAGADDAARAAKREQKKAARAAAKAKQEAELLGMPQQQ